MLSRPDFPHRIEWKLLSAVPHWAAQRKRKPHLWEVQSISVKDAGRPVGLATNDSYRHSGAVVPRLVGVEEPSRIGRRNDCGIADHRCQSPREQRGPLVAEAPAIALSQSRMDAQNGNPHRHSFEAGLVLVRVGSLPELPVVQQVAAA